MLRGMPRPSRVEEAKDKLREHYAAYGGMPSIQVFAELMGYASPSSAHDVTNALVEQGFLAKDERARRLLPGPKFSRKRHQPQPIPPELLATMPKDVELEVLRVPKGSPLVGDGVLPGDYLVLAPAERRDLAAELLLTQGRRRVLGTTVADGWRVAAVVVAQFRSYRS